MIGKKIRLERILDRKSNHSVIVPLDHGVTVGPIYGIESLADTINDVAEGGADAVLMHKGMVKYGHRGYGHDIGLIIHLSAGTSIAPDPDAKVLVGTVAEAVRLGADAVSVHINVGAENEGDMLADLGTITEDCDYYGMPLLAMMYPRGPAISREKKYQHAKHVARLGAEIGADVIKTIYTGDKKTFKEVIDGCPAPVVIAGGPKIESEGDLFRMVEDAIDVGAAGVSIGRNVFQAKNRVELVSRICGLVHRRDQ